jgi:hypothetical protein
MFVKFRKKLPCFLPASPWGMPRPLELEEWGLLGRGRLAERKQGIYQIVRAAKAATLFLEQRWRKTPALPKQNVSSAIPVFHLFCTRHIGADQKRPKTTVFSLRGIL